MPLLGVNVDHVATVRQARGGSVPDPVEAALIAQKSGADSIVAHLREDRRHIQDDDIYRLKKKLTIRLNLEMSTDPSVVKVALDVKPDQVTLVPEKRMERTTESGLDVVSHKESLQKILPEFKQCGISVSLFIDAEPEQIAASAELGVEAIEIHTGDYALADALAMPKKLLQIRSGITKARELGLVVNVGHGLDLSNVLPIVRIPEVNEFNIGFSIIARSIEVGLESAIKEMLVLIRS